MFMYYSHWITSLLFVLLTNSGLVLLQGIPLVLISLQNVFISMLNQLEGSERDIVEISIYILALLRLSFTRNSYLQWANYIVKEKHICRKFYSYVERCAYTLLLTLSEKNPKQTKTNILLPTVSTLQVILKLASPLQTTADIGKKDDKQNCSCMWQGQVRQRKRKGSVKGCLKWSNLH